jgi:hypothetical protein
MAAIPTSQSSTTPVLACDEVLRIAHQDAIKAYRDLSSYRVTVVLGEDGWHVDYELTKALVAGGGPHYVIDAKSGAILHKRYEQ